MMPLYTGTMVTDGNAEPRPISEHETPLVMSMPLGYSATPNPLLLC